MKHNITHKLIAVITVLMATTLCARADSFEVDGIRYSGFSNQSNPKTCDVDRILADGAVVIPETVTYEGITYTVTEINLDAIDAYNNITSLSIPGTIEEIMSLVFTHCDKLEEIRFEDSDKPLVWDGAAPFREKPLRKAYVGRDCHLDFGKEYQVRLFLNARSLESVELGGSLSHIGMGAFEGCESLKDITLPPTLKIIDAGAFSIYDYKVPRNVHISDIAAWCNVEFGSENSNPVSCTAGGYLDLNGEPLTDVEIPMGVNRIGIHFKGYEQMRSLTMAESVIEIGAKAFQDCIGLEEIQFSSRIRHIDEYAFYNCQKLKAVELPDDIESIGERAFLDCKAISVVRTKELREIPASAFSGCSSLNSFSFEHITSIGNQAFSGCGSLESITLGLNGHVDIDNSAFSSCGGLKELYIKSGTIGDRAFYGATSLTSLSLGEGVTSIGDKAFEACTSLSSLNIESGITSIGTDALAECTALCEVNIKYAPTALSLPSSLLGSNTQSLERLTLCREVTYGKTSPFSGQQSLKVFSTNEQLKSIPAGLLADCPALTDITLTDGLTAIGEGAFTNCDALTSVSLPQTVGSMGRGVFSSCEKLSSITLPRDLREVPAYAFAGCTFLSEVIWDTENATTDIAESAFQGCRLLSVIELPSSLQSIGNHAFDGCETLSSIVVGDAAQTIGNGAFFNCRSLRSVTLGSSVSFIGSEAFANAGYITEVYSYNPVPPTLEYNVWDSTVLATATLNVAEGSGSAYREAYGWKDFDNIVDPGAGTGINDEATTPGGLSLSTDGNMLRIDGLPQGTLVEVYSANGALLYQGTATDVTLPGRGLYIVRAAGQTAKTVL